ncbi:hypothetical protein [Anaeromyxobacter terrae]|uniref:hypothetical protein n=1 Tax=Anaeromyxobacter terrae TaxID=2925406 RepID=UPI001F597881|nr:hypothetical protein [Anaeromyxobacter sp. SG22]
MLLLAAQAAAGQEPPGSRGVRPTPEVEVAPASSAPERARASDNGLVLELHSDFGFERLVPIEYTDASRTTLHLNDGFAIALGWSFLPLSEGRLGTRVAVGFKLDMLRASNGDALFTGVPVDVMEFAYVGPLRLGAGASVLLWGRTSGSGFLEEARLRFDPSPGVVLDAEWIVAPRTRTGLGVRASWYRFSWNGVARGGPSIGLVIRADLPVGRRVR